VEANDQLYHEEDPEKHEGSKQEQMNDMQDQKKVSTSSVNSPENSSALQK